MLDARALELGPWTLTSDHVIFKNMSISLVLECFLNRVQVVNLAAGVKASGKWQYFVGFITVFEIGHWEHTFSEMGKR